MRISVSFNNYVFDSRIDSGWGFACMAELLDKVVLFDGGGDGSILLGNMAKLGIDPQRVDVVFLSHHHDDHTGGLEKFLGHSSKVTIYMLCSFPNDLKEIRPTCWEGDPFYGL